MRGTASCFITASDRWAEVSGLAWRFWIACTGKSSTDQIIWSSGTPVTESRIRIMKFCLDETFLPLATALVFSPFTLADEKSLCPKISVHLCWFFYHGSNELSHMWALLTIHNPHIIGLNIDRRLGANLMLSWQVALNSDRLTDHDDELIRSRIRIESCAYPLWVSHFLN